MIIADSYGQVQI